MRVNALALLVLPAMASLGCATNTSGLEARVHELELQVAELRAAANQRDARDLRASASAPGANCIDVTIPGGTQFTDAVAFDVGRTSTTGVDRIVITVVRGTRGDFGVGGTYVLRGEYTLASAEEADLAFHVTATDPGVGCTRGNPRASLHVVRGSGRFELANSVPYHGYPHVTFYVHGSDAGGVYFGRGDFLQR